MALTDQIISAESGGDPDAKNPNSSASGAGQFIDSTWLSTLKAHRPDLAQGQSDDALLALKSDPALSKQMVDAYGSDNTAALTKAGVSTSPGSVYLAHFAGPSGAIKVLQADPDTPAADILGPAAVAANPFLKTMTAGGLQGWAAKKVGTPAPVPGAQPQQAPPLQLAPQAPPIFAQQQQQQQQPAQSAPALIAQPQMPAAATPQMQPIFAQAPKQIDLSKLRAALAAARTPIFPGQG
jgi:hypothetical protein